MVALRINDCVAMTSTSTGTGPFTLASALTGFQTFHTMVGADGDYVYYTIIGVDGTGARTGQWETGFAAIGSVGTTIDRSGPMDSSSGTFTNVNFSAGSKQVYLSLTSEAIRTKHALLYLSADLTAQDFSAGAAISWSGDRGGEGAWSSGQPTQLVMPNPGASYIKLNGQVELDAVTTTSTVTVEILASTPLTQRARIFTTATTSPCSFTLTYPLMARPDPATYFTLQLICSDTSITVKSVGTWLAAEWGV